MDEIKKYEIQAGLTFKQQVTYSQQHSLVKEADADLLSNVINIALGKSIQYTGFKIAAADFDILLAGMLEDIQSNAKQLRISEIALAFDRGIKKVYGEWIGLSVVTFSGFIRAYIKDPERLDIMKSLEPEKKEIEKKKWDGTARYNELKSQFEKNGHCEDTGNLVYTWLIDTGKIQKGYGNQFLKEAKEKLIKMQKHLLITELNPSVRQSIAKVLKEIEAGESSLIITLAKKIAVNHYFKNNQL